MERNVLGSLRMFHTSGVSPALILLQCIKIIIFYYSPYYHVDYFVSHLKTFFQEYNLYELLLFIRNSPTQNLKMKLFPAVLALCLIYWVAKANYAFWNFTKRIGLCFV